MNHNLIRQWLAYRCMARNWCLVHILLMAEQQVAGEAGPQHFSPFQQLYPETSIYARLEKHTQATIQHTNSIKPNF